jgi:NAD(P)-dependent dehydrogenase (short-subunit alcohol dehydrogenase family)
MSETFYQDPQVLQRRSAAIPLGRIGTPEDMAQVVMFLASERAAFVNGQEIIVDGGFEHMLMSLVPRPGFERGN